MSSSNFKIFVFFNKIKEALNVFYFQKIKRIFWRGKADKNTAKQKIFDKKLVYLLSKSRIPELKQLKYLKKFLTTSELWLLRFSFIILASCLIFTGTRFYFSHRQIVPIKGGEYTEGLVGSPKYINPLYASLSDVDNDISSLVFSSLLKRDGEGRLVKDLATNYQISNDFKTYTFQIRKDAKWHNGANLTVDDILFTYSMVKNGQYKSPLERSFSGVDLEKIDESTIKFILPEPYAPFLELLTFGIIPQDLWYRVPPQGAGFAELNLKPVGSGPYKFKSLTKDKVGQIKSYSLAVNDDYYKAAAKINLNFKFFPNFEEAQKALNDGDIDGISYLPKSFEKNIIAKNSLSIYKLNLPQVTAIFFNKKNNSLLDQKEARRALALAVDKNKIINDVLGGDAHSIDGPILPNNFAFNPNNKKYQYDKEGASKLLEDSGWKAEEITADEVKKLEEGKEKLSEEEKKKAEAILLVGAGKWRKKDNNFLAVKLTTVETEENAKAAELIKIFWEEIGVKTNIELVQEGEINSQIIKPRNFEALLYSEIVGADPDLYVFWHSSHIGESGLNLSNYENKEVDQLLEEARITDDIEQRKSKYIKFQEIITEELPAIFLYSPTYNYIQSKKIKGFNVKDILMPRDRFANINDWYIQTGKKLIWK